MPEKLTQQDRYARLVTPLGADVLVLAKLDATEAISENFEWRISCLLNDGQPPVDPQALIGQPIHVEVDTDSPTKRYFSGICTSVRFRGWRGGYMHYELVSRPWTWLLTRETRSRIFHDMSARDIMDKIFKNAGFSDFQFKLNSPPPVIPYCVQYRETTYDFVLRLMEKYGLFFFFEFTAQAQNLIIVDGQTALPDIPEYGYGRLRFQPDSTIGIRRDCLHGWQKDSRLRTAVYEVDDYNYETPNTKLDVAGNAKDRPKHGHAKLRKYHYPAGHPDTGKGKKLVDALIDAERGDAERKFAHGFAPLISAGGVFILSEHPIKEENTRHFAIRAHHTVFVQHFRSDNSAAETGHGALWDDGPEPEGDQYYGQYEVADAALAYQPLPVTQQPRIYGAQTATVIAGEGAAGEEIDVDKDGRILVQFHWKDTAEGPKPSCRVRVAQIWAGAQWGGVWIPRVGMEAVVEFIEGDPDRPLVTGTVYNGKNKPPIAFPANKTQSTIKSNSSKGGGGFNELRFEDKKGAEQIYIHAQHDRLMEIENADTTTIKQGNRTTTLERGNEIRTLQAGKRTTTIKMDDTRTIQTGNDVVTVKGGNQTTTLDLGSQTTKMSAGKGTVQAMQSYEIKVGSSSIKLTPASIEIKSAMIKIEASGKLEAKGTITKVDGSAMLMLKGGMIKIN